MRRWNHIASEKLFENKIKNYLKNNECYFVKFFANRMTKVGVPDLLCCINGYFVGIEVKAESGTPSELQKHNRDAIKYAGGISVILYPQDWDLFKTMVEQLFEDDELGAWHTASLINNRTRRR